MGPAIGKSQNAAVIIGQTMKNFFRLQTGESTSRSSLRPVDLPAMPGGKNSQNETSSLPATDSQWANLRAYGPISNGLPMSSGVVPSNSILTGDSRNITNGRQMTRGVAAFPTRIFTAYHIGNSLTQDLFYDFRAVATRYEATWANTYLWGFHFRPGSSLTFIYNHPTPLATPYHTTSGVGLTDTSIWPNTNLVPWLKSLPANHWDVVTMEPFPGNSTDGPATLGSDTAAINAMIALTKTSPENASTRFFIYETWPRVTYGDITSYSTAWLAPTPNYPSVKSALNRNYFTYLVSAVRQTNPNVEVIPVGEVFNVLDMKMRAGQFQGFKSINQLHRDSVHLNSLGQNVVSWTAYATIFKESPVGLRNDVLDNAAVSPFVNVTAISPADMLLIQQTVWDVVRNSSSPRPSPRH